jgi:hypothetical protein
MPRQPIAGAGAASRSPSGAAARAPAPIATSTPTPSLAPSPSSPLSPLPPQRYRALRARYNALLVTLYERTSLTLLDIAMIAGRTERAVQIMVRTLGCRPRRGWCRPGTNLGVRRDGPRPLQLTAPATRRVVAAFAEVARELAASSQMRADSELQRATARAQRRTARTQMRVMTGAARELRHLAAAMEDMAAARHALPGAPKRARKPAQAKRPSRAEMRAVQERAWREGQAQMWEAHQRAAAAKAAAVAVAAEPPVFSPEVDARINATATRYDVDPRVRPRPQPRVRRL